MCVRVKPCRNQKQIRFESDQFVERTLRDLENCLAWCVWRDWIIIDIRERFRSSPRIRGELMNRRKSNSLIVPYYRLGAIAVMPIKIPNRNTLDFSRGR